MTKQQMQGKLALLPLQSPVVVEEELDENMIPRLVLSYDVVPGPGTTVLSVYADTTPQQLRDMVANLPLNTADQLASLAILLVPVNVGL
jgi:hypothetical protein